MTQTEYQLLASYLEQLSPTMVHKKLHRVRENHKRIKNKHFDCEI